MSDIVKSVVELLDIITPCIDDGKVTDEISENIALLTAKITEEAERSVVVDKDYVLKTIESFDDITARSKDIVIIETDKGQIGIPIKSISVAEASRIRRYNLENEPVNTAAMREKDGAPDKTDTHYAKDMAKHEDALLEHVNRLYFEYLKYGLDLEIPGKNDDEKYENTLKMFAGALKVIVEGIQNISYLNEDKIGPFGTRYSRQS